MLYLRLCLLWEPGVSLNYFVSSAIYLSSRLFIFSPLPFSPISSRRTTSITTEVMNGSAGFRSSQKTRRPKSAWLKQHLRMIRLINVRLRVLGTSVREGTRNGRCFHLFPRSPCPVPHFPFPLTCKSVLVLVKVSSHGAHWIPSIFSPVWLVFESTIYRCMIVKRSYGVFDSCSLNVDSEF